MRTNENKMTYRRIEKQESKTNNPRNESKTKNPEPEIPTQECKASNAKLGIRNNE